MEYGSDTQNNRLNHYIVSPGVFDTNLIPKSCIYCQISRFMDFNQFSSNDKSGCMSLGKMFQTIFLLVEVHFSYDIAVQLEPLLVMMSQLQLLAYLYFRYYTQHHLYSASLVAVQKRMTFIQLGHWPWSDVMHLESDAPCIPINITISQLVE